VKQIQTHTKTHGHRAIERHTERGRDSQKYTLTDTCHERMKCTEEIDTHYDKERDVQRHHQTQRQT
jgi:hypothetical protein